MTDYRRPTVLAFITSCLSIISGLLTNIIVYRVLVHHAGMTAFGMLTVMLSLVTHLGLLEFGLNYGAARFIAAANARNDKEQSQRIAGTTFRLNIALMFAVAVGGCLIYALLTTLIPSKFVSLQYQRNVWFLIVAWQASLFPFRTFSSILIGSSRLWEVNIITAGTSLLTSAIALILIPLGFGIAALPLGNLLAGIAGGIVTLSRVGFKEAWDNVIKKGIDTGLLKIMFAFNVWATLGGLLWGLQGAVDQWATAALLGPAFAASVFLLYRFPLLGASFLTKIADSLSPSVTAMVAREEKQRVRAVLHRVLNLTAALILSFSAVWVIVGRPLIHWWLPDSLNADTWTVNLFGLAAFANIPLMVLLTGWVALGQMRGYCLYLLLQLGVKVSILLTGLGWIGINAVPLSILLSMFMLTAWESWRLSKVGILSFRMIALLCLKSFAILVLIFGAAELLKRVMGNAPNDALYVGWGLLLSALPIILLTVFSLVDAEERYQFRSLAKNQWRGLVSITGRLGLSRS